MQCPRCHNNLRVEDVLRGATDLSESQGKDCCFRCSLFSTCSFPCLVQRGRLHGDAERALQVHLLLKLPHKSSRSCVVSSSLPLSSFASVPHGLVSPAGHGLVVCAREMHAESSQDELKRMLEHLVAEQYRQTQMASCTQEELRVGFRVVRDMIKGQQGESSGSPSTSGGGGGGGGDTAAGF